MIHERQLDGITDPRALLPPLVLVADEDEAVRDLLHLAFSSHHWRVITAADGDEALQRALAERPDMVVLSHPLPRKGGLEVCDYLRHDPEDPNVPVLVLSTYADSDLRLEALRRGADDVMSKPFSPRELLARGRRLLVRAQDARRLRRERVELERELHRAREDGRRTREERDRERELRAVASGLGRELHDRLSTASIAGHLLLSARNLSGAAGAALFTRTEGYWELQDSLGPAGDRLAGLPRDRLEVLEMTLLASGRPRVRHELERGLDRDTGSALAAAGLALAVPLVSPEGLEGALLLAERWDGHAHAAATRETLAVLGPFAASALRSARRFTRQASDMLGLAISRAERDPRARRVAFECADSVDDVARGLRLAPHLRESIGHAVRAGAWGWSTAGTQELTRHAERDASGFAREVVRLVEAGRTLEPGPGRLDPTAVTLVGVASRACVVRGSGRSHDESWNTALAWVAPGGELRAIAALRAALGG